MDEKKIYLNMAGRLIVCVWLCVSVGMSHMKVNQYAKELLCCSVYACKSVRARVCVCVLFLLLFLK